MENPSECYLRFQSCVTSVQVGLSHMLLFTQMLLKQLWNLHLTTLNYEVLPNIVSLIPCQLLP